MMLTNEINGREIGAASPAVTEQLAASPGHPGEHNRMMLLMSQPKRQSQQTGCSAAAEDENLLSGPVYP